MFEKLRSAQVPEEPYGDEAWAVAAPAAEDAPDQRAVDSPMRRPRPSLASLMAEEGIASREQLDEALAEGQETGERLGEVVLRQGWTTEAGLANLIARQWDIAFVARSVIAVDENAQARMSRDDAARLGVCPVSSNDGSPLVAMADPSEERFAAAREALDGPCTFVVTTPSALAQLIDALPASAATPEATGVAEAPAETPPPVFAAPEVENEAEATPEANPPAAIAAAEPEPEADPSPVLDQLDRLLDQLVSERVRTADHLAGYRSRLAELADERARLEENVRSLETKLGHEDQLLESMRTKLGDLAPSLDLA
jgi:type IV pilus assembly protein PilB